MTILDLSHLSKYYFSNKENKPVVDDLNLKVPKGTIYGFLGPNGAGKTTTIKLILNLIRPDSGKIKIFNKTDINSVKSKIGFMSEQPYFYHYLTGWEVMHLAADLFEIKSSLKLERINSLLEEVGLIDSAHVSVKNYSKGMNQRLGLATALVNNPELLLLDEPLDGLDPIGRLMIKQILLKHKKRGATIFFNSHILADAEEICDCVGIIHNGKLIQEGNPKKLIKKGETLEKYFVKIINDYENK